MSVQAQLISRTNELAEAVTCLRVALHSGVWQRMTDQADGSAPTPFDAVARGRACSMAGAHRLELDHAMRAAADALGRAVRLAALYPEQRSVPPEGHHCPSVMGLLAGNQGE